MWGLRHSELRPVERLGSSIIPAMICAVVLIGAPGAGKSSVLEELETLLELDGVGHGAIESEELGRGSPPLPALLWVNQLASVLKVQRDAGRQLFVIAATVESAGELCAVSAAACADRLLVVCLSAPPDVAAARVEHRELDRWPGKRSLIAHARRLAASIPRLDGIDVAIETDGRDAAEVAADVRLEMRGRGLLPGRPD